MLNYQCLKSWRSICTVQIVLQRTSFPTEREGVEMARIVSIVVLLIVAGFVAGPAQADPIGPNCGSCNGGIYTLSYSGVPLPDADPIHETFRVTYHMDLTNYTLARGTTFVHEVAVKITSNV